MSVAEDAAILIMKTLHEAEDDLMGREFTYRGEAVGFVTGVKLDDVHGLRVTANRGLRYFPLSTVVFTS
jgi:hypothetical protein